MKVLSIRTLIMNFFKSQSKQTDLSNRENININLLDLEELIKENIVNNFKIIQFQLHNFYKTRRKTMTKWFWQHYWVSVSFDRKSNLLFLSHILTYHRLRLLDIIWRVSYAKQDMLIISVHLISTCSFIGVCGYPSFSIVSFPCIFCCLCLSRLLFIQTWLMPLSDA